MMYHERMFVSRWIFRQRAVMSVVIGLLGYGTVAFADDDVGLELVMLEQALCEWCEAWDAEIGPIYPKTWEGRAAPLRRVDIFDERPADLKSMRPTQFTPTFVLMRNGEEVGRMTGYVGEDFFWGLLDQLLAKAGVQVPAMN